MNPHQAVYPVPEVINAFGSMAQVFNTGVDCYDHVALEMMKSLVVRTDKIILTPEELADEAFSMAEAFIRRSNHPRPTF